MIGTTIREGKRNYICDDCKEEFGQFRSYQQALAAGWAIARGRKVCYCPKCAPAHRHVGRFGGKRAI